MTAILAPSAAGATQRLSFHFWLIVVMTAFVFVGFTLTYWQPLAAGTLPATPPVVHLHGAVFSSWMLLLLVQSLLVNVRQVQLHRSLGTFGIALATAMLFTGTLITLLSGAASDHGGAVHANLTYLSMAAMVSFATLFVLAIRQVRKPEQHRRLILFATIPLLPPGINRLYMVSMGLAEPPILATYLTMDLLVAAILFHDWRTLGRFSQASLVGAAFVLGQQLLHIPIANSDAFDTVCRYLSGLMYYR